MPLSLTQEIAKRLSSRTFSEAVIEIGKYNVLRIDRVAEHGLYLTDAMDNDVLLPNKYCPKEYELGDELKVFVYLDSSETKVATNLEPLIKRGEFAHLQIVDVGSVGAFADMGLEKQLLIPFAEQQRKLQEGESYVVYMNLDEQSNRLYGSTKIKRHTQNENLSVEIGDEVEVIIYNISDLGYNAIINNKHLGLLFKNEVFKQLQVGERTNAFVKKIRAKNKIDLSLQAIGYRKFKDGNSQLVYDALLAEGGHLAMGDKSPAEEIYERFGISKKAFKRALGDLYKQRKITIAPRAIKLVKSGQA